MAFISNGSSYKFSFDTPAGLWHWGVEQTTNPSYTDSVQITDLTSPFGRLDQVSIPIPGSVFNAIADSLASVSANLRPILAFASGSQVNFNFTVTEGDPQINVGSLVITNNGNYGSVLEYVASSSNPYIVPNPDSGSGVLRLDTSNISLIVDPTLLSSNNTPYTSSVRVDNPKSLDNYLSVPITINVLPRPSINVTPVEVNFTYDRSTGTFSGPIYIDIENNGPATSLLTVYISKMINCSPWLNLSSLVFTSIESGDQEVLALSLNNSYFPGLDGTYKEVIKVSSLNSSNGPFNITVNLNVVS